MAAKLSDNPLVVLLPVFLSVVTLLVNICGFFIDGLKKLPKYMKVFLWLSAFVWLVLAILMCFGIKNTGSLKIGNLAILFLCVLGILTVSCLATYLSFWHRLNRAWKLEAGKKRKKDIIDAFRLFEKIDSRELTFCQIKKYNRLEIYLNMRLGNLKKALSDSEKYKETDVAFYEWVQYLCIRGKGDIRSAKEHIKRADDAIKRGLEPIIAAQIKMNHAKAFFEDGEYQMADDFFEKTKTYAERKKLKSPNFWILFYSMNSINLMILGKIKSLEDIESYLKNVYIKLKADKNIESFLFYVDVRVKLLMQSELDESKILWEMQKFVNTTLLRIENEVKSIEDKIVLVLILSRIIKDKIVDVRGILEFLALNIERLDDLKNIERFYAYKNIAEIFVSNQVLFWDEINRLGEKAREYFNSGDYEKDIKTYLESLPTVAVYKIADCYIELAQCKFCFLPLLGRNISAKNDFNAAIALYNDNGLDFEIICVRFNLINEILNSQNFPPDQAKMTIIEQTDCIESALPNMSKQIRVGEFYLRLSDVFYKIGEEGKCLSYYKLFKQMYDEPYIVNLPRGIRNMYEKLRKSYE